MKLINWTVEIREKENIGLGFFFIMENHLLLTSVETEVWPHLTVELYSEAFKVWRGVDCYLKITLHMCYIFWKCEIIIEEVQEIGVHQSTFIGYVW